MNAKELMIGDLVYGLYPNGERYATPCCISAVDTYPTNRSPRIVTAGGYGFQSEHLEPIPITEKILEKNFGEKIDGEYFYADEYYEIYIKEISDSIWKIDYECVEMNGIPRQSNNVCFVHELQHALRLFGLFEMADCFSV